MLGLGDEFVSMKEALEYTKSRLLRTMKTYRVERADRSRYVLICTERRCDFRVVASSHPKSPVIKITVMKPSTCGPLSFIKASSFIASHL